MHRILHPVAKLCFALLCAVLLMSTTTAAAQTQTAKDSNWSYPTEKPANPFDGGDGSEGNPYRIRTAQQLANLSYMVNNGEEYKGKYFLMTDDIVLNEGVMNDDGTYNAEAASSAKKWTSIGDPQGFDYDYFKGFFDGGGHTVYGFCQNFDNRNDDKYKERGFFGCVSNAIISNLTISHSYLYSMGQGWQYGPGFFSGEAEGTTFSNVHVKNSYFYEYVDDPREKFIGGIVGLGNGVEIKDCSFDGTIDVYAQSAQSTLNVGGIAGILSAQASKVTGCKTSGRLLVTQHNDDMSTFALGGLIGLLRAGLTLNRCLNMMDIEVHHDNPEDVCCNLYAGGIGGLLEMKNYDLDINHCVNLGNISVGGDGEKLDMDNHRLMLSGIANVESNITIFCSQTLNVSDCANYGNFDVDASTFLSDDADEKLLVAGCCALRTLAIGTIYSNWTRCISVGNSHDLYADRTDIRYAPIMGFLDRPDDKKYIKDVSDCYYYTNITTNRLDVDSRLNGTSLDRFYNRTPFTTNRNNPWTLLTANESKTWAGYAVPYTPFFTMTKLSGSGTKDDPYLITNEKELLTLNTIMANKTGYDKYYRLMNDLDMTNMGTFPTIVNGNTGFIGTFDGNGRYINGLRVSGHAMFDKLSGTVKNLTLTNFRGNETANHNTSIASSLYGTIENCAVYGTISACGRDIYDEKVEVSGIAGLVSNDGSTFVGHIKNCVFKGMFKVSPLLNGKTVGNVTKRLRYDGICNYLNCDKGSGSSVTGCYASYTIEGADDTGFTNVDRTAGVGDNTNYYGVMENNYFVCPQTPKAYIKNPGVFRAESEAEITPDLLGDTKGTVWLQGVYRPVNTHNKHLTVTDHNGAISYLDLCPDDAWTLNKVYTATMTQDNAEDRVLQQFKNLALYNPQSHTAYIINLELDRALSDFYYKPLDGCTATKGATRVTLKKDDALTGAPGHYLLCLPCPLRTADLPAGSEIHGLGYFPKNEDKTGESVFYLTECDSVGAGVPCHVYIPDCKDGDFTLLSYGDIVAAPQGTAENGPQGYFKAQNVRDAFTGITLNVTTPHSLTYAASTDVKIFGAAATSTSKTTTQLLSIIRVLDESDPYLHETIHALNGVSKANLYVKRTLVADEWNTLTLPFTIEANTLAFHCGEGNTLQVQKLANVTTEDGGLVLYFEDASTLEAGKPYLVKPKATCTSINLFDEPCILNEVLTSVSAHDVHNLYEVTMLPNYAPLVLVAGDYFLQDNMFYVVAEGMTVKSKGMRARFTANAAASAALQSARLVFDNGDVTGIDGITPAANAPAAVYDLSGRRVEKPAHGLYIVNGRKVLLP